MNTYLTNTILFLIINLLLSIGLLADDLPDFTALAEDASKSVVNIRSTKKVKSSRYNQFNPRGFSDPQYDEFFKRFFGERPRRSPAPNERNVNSAGSGFIISEDGYILTNSHVVIGADEIKVSLSDRREYVAELIGLDERADVALLKIDAKRLPKVKLGKSENLKVGEWVMAIGSPFQLNFSVTAGIVSAKGRSIPSNSETSYVPFIQTDVAINPGNSGGPLFNLAGEVVGINSMIYSGSGGYMGVSFSIPIDYAVDISDQLMDTGKVARGWLGVSIQEVTSDLAEGLGLVTPKGALISQVIPDSPAEKSGYKERDVIIEFNKKAIVYSGDLPQTVGAIKPNTKVSSTIYRDGKKKVINVTVGELPTDQSNILGSASQLSPLGLIVEPLSADEKETLRLKGGVKVIKIDTELIAAQAGIRIGDIIAKISNRPINSIQDFTEVSKDLIPGKNFTMRIIRNGNPFFLSLKLPK